MKKIRYASLVLILAIVSFLGGAWWNHRASTRASAETQVLYYACPMHPQYKSDRAGDCPSCGMRLEPVHADGSTAPGEHRPAGAVHVSPERQQTIGVSLGQVERVAGTKMLRTTGRVAPNENATYPIVAGTSGWIRSVGNATTGSRVAKDERLATFYSPEFIVVQQSWYAGLETFDRVANQQVVSYNQNVVVEGVQRFADTLRNMGVSEVQLAQMRHKRDLVQDIYLTSPVNGFVLLRNASTGLRFDRGFELFRIADLRDVWILADVYEHQRPFVRPGMTARITSPQQNRAFVATVSTAEPIFDEATLTLKLRLEADNPGFVLKPGMFVDVELPIDLPSTLAVPADAIVDSGLRKVVFVDRGNGYFEPRQVETGWRLEGQVEIIKGLMAGERIVISGTFLIDSESRMKAAAMGVFGTAAKDPVCGMDVDEKRAAAAGRTADHGGATYYFCSVECKEKFEKDPERYLRSGRPGAPPDAAGPKTAAGAGGQEHGTAIDPVCGMDVDKAEAAAAGRKSVHDARTSYFCSDDCKRQFDDAPATYIRVP